MTGEESTRSSWTESERCLYECFVAGRPFDVTSLVELRGRRPSNSESWPKDCTVRAEVVAQLLLSAPETVPDKPARLVVRGALITGRLDLGCGDVGPFWFRSCIFDHQPNLADSRTQFVGFTSCSIKQGIEASRMVCSGAVWLDDSIFDGPIMFEDAKMRNLRLTGIEIAQQAGHGLCLCGASVERDLNLAGSTLHTTLGLAGARVGGGISLANVEIGAKDAGGVNGRNIVCGGSLIASPNFVCNGSVALDGSIINGRLGLRGARIVGKANSVALGLDHSEIKLGLHAGELRVDGALSIHHASVFCQLDLQRAQITSSRGTALRADHIDVHGTILLNEQPTIEGTIDLHGARVECSLNLRGLRNSCEGERRWGLIVDSAKIGGAFLLNDAECKSGVNLNAVEIEGLASFSKGVFASSKNDAALSARRAVFNGGIVASSGTEFKGAIYLEDALVSNVLDISDAKIQPQLSGKAISGSRLAVRGDVLGNRVRISGSVDLAGCSITGDARFADAQLDGSPAEHASRGLQVDARHGGSWRGTAMRLSRANIAGDLVLSSARLFQSLDMTSTSIGKSIDLNGAELTGTAMPALIAYRLTAQALQLKLNKPPANGLDLRDARVDVLADDDISWPPGSHIDIEGMQYSTILSPMTDQERLRWLQRATRKFTPQPYVQLARHYRNTGNPDAARRIELDAAKRKHSSGSLFLRIWGFLQDVTVGYGYRPGRACGWLIGLLFAGTIWFQFGIGTCAEKHYSASGLCPVNVNSHPSWNAFMFTLDKLVPILKIGQANAWLMSGFSEIVSLVLTVGGSLMITTIAAGIARTLRRP